MEFMPGNMFLLTSRKPLVGAPSPEQHGWLQKTGRHDGQADELRGVLAMNHGVEHLSRLSMVNDGSVQ